jgi:hypothetical protein
MGSAATGLATVPAGSYRSAKPALCATAACARLLPKSRRFRDVALVGRTILALRRMVKKRVMVGVILLTAGTMLGACSSAGAPVGTGVPTTVGVVPTTVGQQQLSSECQAVGGRWSHIPFGGYYIDQTDWDCTVNGFQDQLVSFSTGTFDVPLGLVAVVASLMHDCVQAGGELSLDTFSKTQPQPFACVLGGTHYDDLTLTPQPHFVVPLDQAVAQEPAGTPPSGTTGTTPPTPTPTAPTAPTAPPTPTTPPSGTTGTTPPSGTTGTTPPS